MLKLLMMMMTVLVVMMPILLPRLPIEEDIVRTLSLIALIHIAMARMYSIVCSAVKHFSKKQLFENTYENCMKLFIHFSVLAVRRDMLLIIHYGYVVIQLAGNKEV